MQQLVFQIISSHINSATLKLTMSRRTKTHVSISHVRMLITTRQIWLTEFNLFMHSAYWHVVGCSLVAIVLGAQCLVPVANRHRYYPAFCIAEMAAYLAIKNRKRSKLRHDEHICRARSNVLETIDAGPVISGNDSAFLHIIWIHFQR